MGGKSDNSYLVLEVHYASADKFLGEFHDWSMVFLPGPSLRQINTKVLTVSKFFL